MLTKSFKKLSQATAVTALGVAMLASVGSTSAHAATFKTFTISGNFKPQAAIGSTGIAVSLQGGTFDGTYTVDIDKLPTSTQVPLTSWLINLRDTSNNILRQFSNTFVGNTGQVVGNSLKFTNSIGAGDGESTESLGLTFPSGFTGSPATGITDGRFSQVVDLGYVFSGGRLGVKPSPVPEPLATTGIAVAGAMGLWLKRKQKTPIA
ncbi:PEP-CTERM sorting domain-containing protein [Nostoc sp. FACHB-110]|uniref:PEP-CTERM sorting domain-containing protein n=1 Tax=Nostoc sp. FACHB-110 TaxID=2692834 RepID=UPI0016850143|nr:PEP-CTERM sorting domain-containing protein [Nostoc sp. FACHB-110]